MKLKQHDLITTGLSSEVFLHAFLEPSSGYAIARKLEKSEKKIGEAKKTPTNYSKVDKALDALIRDDYLRHDIDKKKYYPRITRILWDIVDLLKTKNFTIDKKEFELLKAFLRRRDFLKIISADAIKKMREQPKGVHKINALSIFCNRIGMVAACFKFAREHFPEWKKNMSEISEISIDEIIRGLKEFDVEWDEVLKETEPKLEELLKKHKISREEFPGVTIIEDVFKSVPSMAALLFAPSDTLEKLSNIWDQYGGFKLGIDMALRIDKKTKSILNSDLNYKV